MKNTAYIILTGFLFFTNIQSFAQSISQSNFYSRQVPGIPNFQTTNPYIFRGARPKVEGLNYLKSVKIKTIINLEDNMDAVNSEQRYLQGSGIQYFSFPMSAFKTPNDQQVSQILKLLANPAAYPVFIHCHYGMDRTGLMIGLYRVLFEKWSPNQAYQEMLQYGFHPKLTYLDNYFKLKTSNIGRRW